MHPKQDLQSSDKGIPDDFGVRLEAVRSLARAFADPMLCEQLIDAYGRDTLLLPQDIRIRETLVPARLCALPILGARPLREARASGGVAVLVPKNSVGLTIAKAVVGAYLTGNRVSVRFPIQLEHSGPVFSQLLQQHLPGVEIAPRGPGHEFLARCIADPQIDSVVIYGDDAWIGAYREQAEATRTRILFEGPGNDPLVVLPDADTEASVDAAIRGGLLNGGQSCSAFERFFVHRSRHAAFVECLRGRLQHMRIGPSTEPGVSIGPIVSRLVRERLSAQIQSACEQGAQLVMGGQIVDSGVPGAPALQPTILTQCRVGMRVVDEENFGAVFPILAYDSLDDLLPALEASQHGLNAAAFGHCPERLSSYLRESHRNAYENSTPADAKNLPSRLADGGMKRSAFMWEHDGERYAESRGRRLLALELSAEPRSLRSWTEPMLQAACLPALPTDLI